MKRFTVCLFFCLLISCAANQQQFQNDNFETPAPAYQAEFPLQMPIADAQFVRVDKRIVSYTKSIPPHYSYETLGYVYNIRLFITVIGDSTYFAEPFVAICELPNGREEFVTLNPDGLQLENGVMSEFHFELKTKNKGTLHITLATYDDETGGYYVVDEFSPFLQKFVDLR